PPLLPTHAWFHPGRGRRACFPPSPFCRPPAPAPRGPRVFPSPPPPVFPPPWWPFLPVAPARRSASSDGTPRDSYPSSMCSAWRFCLSVYLSLSPRGISPLLPRFGRNPDAKPKRGANKPHRPSPDGGRTSRRIFGDQLS